MTLCVLILSFCLLSVSAANTRASAYITSTYMDVIPTGEGELAVEFSILGTGRMSRIGAQAISFYRENGSSWTYLTSYYDDDEGMAETNTYSHGNTMYYQGVSGTRYKVIVTLFAENSSGSDSRTEAFYVIG